MEIQNKQAQFSNKLYLAYIEVIEFINQQQFSDIFTKLLLSLQTIFMLSDLISNIWFQNQFIRAFLYFAIIPSIKDSIKNNKDSTTKYAIISICLILLFNLIFFILFLILSLWVQNKLNQKNQHKKIIDNTFYLKLIRTFVVTYQYLYLPFFLPLLIFMTCIQATGIFIFITVIIMTFMIVVYCFIQFHLLELQPNISIPYQLIRKNLGSNFLDIIIITIYYILIHTTSENLSIAFGLTIFLLRIVLSFYMPFYDQIVNRYHQFLQGCGIIIIGSLFISYKFEEPIISIFLAFVLIVIWSRLIFEDKKTNYLLITNEQQVELNKFKLIQDQMRNGSIGKAYKALLILEKNYPSHRQSIFIEILKRRCCVMLTAANGGSKILSIDDLINFEFCLIKTLNKLIRLAQKSKQILKFMQIRDPKCQIFLQQVQIITNLIEQIQSLIKNMIKINTSSTQVLDIMVILCQTIVNDQIFIRYIQQFCQNYAETLIQKKQRKKIFNNNSFVIYININNQIGKITKVSKNITRILGYQKIEMLTKNINDILPQSIRSAHILEISEFVNNYTKKQNIPESNKKFYLYNKLGYIQHVLINYYLHFQLNSLNLCGSIKKLNIQYPVVIINQYGKIQGWTKDINQLLDFHLLDINNYTQLNLFLMIPALIKFIDIESQQPIQLRTLFFFPDDPKKCIVEQSITKQNYKQNLVENFQKKFKDESIKPRKFVQLVLNNSTICHGRARFKKIQIKKTFQIQKPSIVLQEIIGKHIQQKTQLENSNNFNADASNISTVKSSKYKYDLNFTADPNSNNQFISMYKTNNTTDLSADQFLDYDDGLGNDIASKHSTPTMLSINSKISINSTPSFQKNKIGYIFIPLSIIFFTLVMIQQIIVSNFAENVIQQCKKVIKRNQYFMILAKSVFNPNMTYISRFQDGYFIQATDWMIKQQYNYYTLPNYTINISKFYLFNIGIPAMLDRLVLSNNFNEITYNFNNLVIQFDSRLERSLQAWNIQVQKLQLYSYLRISFIILGSVVYVLYLIYMYLKSKNRNKTISAFFKFEKSDLEHKGLKIEECIEELYLKIKQWNLKEQYQSIIKGKLQLNLSNIISKQNENKINYSDQRQTKITKKKTFSLVIYISIFLMGQIIFIIIYGVLSNNLIKLYGSIPHTLDNSCKLLVLPNLQIANLFNPVPPNIISKYSLIIPQILQYPSSDIPILYQLFNQSPCMNCTFLYPLLTTNFRSFYSSFASIINQKNLNNNKNVTELYYGVDVVLERIKKSLLIRQIPNISQTIWLYIISLIIFILQAYYGYIKMKKESDNLQVFLKFFDEQTLLKNKHLNNIVKKAI